MAAAVVVVLVSGCGGDGGDEGAKAVSSPSTAPVVTPTVQPSEDEYPPGPEGDIDRLAGRHGWMDGGAPSVYVADLCAALPDRKGVGSDPAEWLMGQKRSADEVKVLRAGVPLLCPEWSKTVEKALGGEASRSYSGGTYQVKANPGVDKDAIAPGTYRAKGDLADCYWERTSRSGAIIDNSFATSAQEITVTIRASDGQFTSRDCGTWRPVK